MRPPVPAAAVLVCGALVLAGCSTPRTSTSTETSSPATASGAAAAPTQAVAPTSDTPQPVPGTPDLVVDQVVIVYFGADTTTDTSPADARVRATPWMTPTLAASASYTNPGGGGGGAEWLDLASHHGKYVVTSTDATSSDPSLPADTPTTASRGRLVTLTPAGTDGWTGPAQTLYVRLDLVKTDGRWLVNTLTSGQPTNTDGAMDAG